MHPPPFIGILCVDDHPIVQDGLRAVIDAEADMCVTGQAFDGRTAVELFHRLKPDVTLMDLQLPVMDGRVATRVIRADCPSARVIALTGYVAEAYLRGAIDAGVQGFVLKDALRNELLTAIRAVHSGQLYMPTEVGLYLSGRMRGDYLSAREREVLDEMSKGFSNRAIGRQLHISTETVKSHVSAILKKLGVEDRTQAVVTALRRGLVRLN
jgi:two-component system, NarL family, response regulator